MLVISTLLLSTIYAASECIPRVLKWDEDAEQMALLNCISGTGNSDKSLTATMCSGQEKYQPSLDLSLAHRLFRTCDSRCVYNIDLNDADNIKAFLWNNKFQCWRPKSDGLCLETFEDHYEHVKMFVEDILCPAEPTLKPSRAPTEKPTVCIEVVQVWDQDTASAALEDCVDGTGESDKSLTARVCEKHTGYQDTLDLSLANRLWAACDSRCVYSINATEIPAFRWNSNLQCWKAKSTGSCLKDDDYATVTSYMTLLCPGGCVPYKAWSADREDELCPGDEESDTISHDAVLCDTSDGSQEGLEKSLANKLFHDCSSVCVYDYEIMENNVRYDLVDNGGYIWRASKSCWKWVIEGRCFDNLIEEYNEAWETMDNICRL